jgi:hypothetical protein
MLKTIKSSLLITAIMTTSLLTLKAFSQQGLSIKLKMLTTGQGTKCCYGSIQNDKIASANER